MNTSSSHHILIAVVIAVALGLCGAPAQAMVVTQLDLTGGAVNYDGKFHRVLDRLLDQPGTLLMGQYQPGPDIVPPVTRGHRTFSLFTSGVQGAPAPSATINGSSISVDLSSLFFGWSRGGELRAWSIGGMATGLFNPQTLEFSLSWEHLFNERGGNWKHEKFRDRSATFFLQGTAVVTQAPIPLPAAAIFFGSGLAGLLGMVWKWRPTSSGSLPI
jgi:hypothetical protein